MKKAVTKRGRGRPRVVRPKLTSANGTFPPDVIEHIISEFEAGVPLLTTCKKLGHNSARSFNKRRIVDEVLDARFKEAKRLNTMHYENILEEEASVKQKPLAPKRNMTALIFLLKARDPNTYRDNVNVNHSASSDFAAAFVAAMTGRQQSDGADKNNT